MRRMTGLAFTIAAMLALGGCASEGTPLTLAPQVDLDRYAGRWYIIANIPYFAENAKSAAISMSASRMATCMTFMSAGPKASTPSHPR